MAENRVRIPIGATSAWEAYPHCALRPPNIAFITVGASPEPGHVRGGGGGCVPLGARPVSPPQSAARAGRPGPPPTGSVSLDRAQRPPGDGPPPLAGDPDGPRPLRPPPPGPARLPVVLVWSAIAASRTSPLPSGPSALVTVSRVSSRGWDQVLRTGGPRVLWGDR